MRRAAGAAVLVLVGALAIPIVTATQVAADNPTLSGPASGPAGTGGLYSYAWNNTCTAPDGDTIVLSWAATNEVMGEGTASLMAGSCMGTLSGQIPTDASPGAGSVVAQLGTGVGVVSGSEATATFTVTVVTPPPTPTPTSRPTPPPTPRPTPTSTAPTVAPTATPKPTPTPKPLPTPPPFIGGGGGGGPGGGAPQGGAACSAGLGRSPTSAELSNDVTQLVSGADPTSIQIAVLASDEYYQDTGGNPMDFINRLYDDVLRPDHTPVEV